MVGRWTALVGSPQDRPLSHWKPVFIREIQQEVSLQHVKQPQDFPGKPFIVRMNPAQGLQDHQFIQVPDLKVEGHIIVQVWSKFAAEQLQGLKPGHLHEALGVVKQHVPPPSQSNLLKRQQLTCIHIRCLADFPV